MRAASSAAVIGGLPGAVDRAPTSRIAAPASACCSATRRTEVGEA